VKCLCFLMAFQPENIKYTRRGTANLLVQLNCLGNR